MHHQHESSNRKEKAEISEVSTANEVLQRSLQIADSKLRLREEINTLRAEKFDLGLDLAENDVESDNVTQGNNEKNMGSVQDWDIPFLTLKEKRDIFKEEDKIFSMTYDKLLNKLWNMREQNQGDQYVQYLTEKKEWYIILRDHLGRYFLHVAVEQGNTLFAEYLLTAG